MELNIYKISYSKIVAFSVILGKILSFPVGIFIANILGPEGYGSWTWIKTLLIYFSYVNLGLLLYNEKQTPFLDKKGDFNKSLALNRFVFSAYTYLTFSLIIILTILKSLNFNFSLNITSFILLIFLLISRNLNNYTVSLISGKGFFNIYGVNLFINNLLSPILLLLGAYTFQLYGLILAMTIINLISFSHIYYRHDLKKYFNLKLNISDVKNHFRQSFQLFINNKLESFINTLSILFLTKIASPKELGIFAFAYSLLYLRNFPFTKPITVRIKRDMNIYAAKFKDISKYEIFFQKNLSLMVLFVLLLLGSISIIFNSIIPVYMPEYQLSIPVIRLLILLVAIDTFKLFTEYFMISQNQYFRLIILKISTIFIISTGVFILTNYNNYSLLNFTKLFVFGMLISNTIQIIVGYSQINNFIRTFRIVFTYLVLSILAYFILIFLYGNSFIEFELFDIKFFNLILQLLIYNTIILLLFFKIFQKHKLFDRFLYFLLKFKL